jgi:hypothetical protein
MQFKHNSRSEQELHEAIEKLYQEVLPTIGKAFDKLEVTLVMFFHFLGLLNLLNSVFKAN